ncbi:MAG: glycoside hydrolase family 31 protein [Firmicutes bacterium]|nr:glycoside hydrolase family 31 protein [Bacillota bacterium]
MREYQSIGEITDWGRAGNTLHFSAKVGTVSVSFLAADLIRVRFRRGETGPASSLMARDGGQGWNLTREDWPEIDLQVEEAPNEVRVGTGEMTVVAQLVPFHLAFYDPSGQLIGRDDPEGGIFWRGSRVGCWKELPTEEQYYGLGEKTGFLGRRGRRVIMWNTDNLPHLPTSDPLYQSIPFLLALREGKAYGIYFNNTWRSYFDLGKESAARYGFYADGGELDYYFFYGPHPKKVIERYSQVTGRAPLPPRWALGYQQSRYSYYPDSAVRAIARQFRERDIPADVLYLDIHYMDEYRVFTWDRERFPDPGGLLRELSELGLKVVTIVDPGVKKEAGYRIHDQGMAEGYFCRYPNGEPFVGEVWPGPALFPDFVQERVRRWWGDLHQDLLQAGVAGIWNDMNEPSVFHVSGKTMDLTVYHGEEGRELTHAEVHNLYGYLMSRATYEGLLRQRPGERPFVLTRAGFAGIQRYAAVWTGDNSSWWEHLSMAIPMLLSLGLSGVPLAGADVGGFLEDGQGELYARWIQLGVFTPFVRTHSAIGTTPQEPWSFGPRVEEIARRYIKLRYRLLPYWYSLFHEAHQTGLPVMRPLLLEYPGDSETYGLDDEFLVGKDLLVAPVYRPAVTQRQVYLPEGIWINGWTGERYRGPDYRLVPAPLDILPLFVRGGAIIPEGPEISHVDQEQAVGDGLTLHLYPVPEVFESSFVLYEDDGHSLDYQAGDFLQTTVTMRQQPGGLKLTLEKVGTYDPGRRTWRLVIHGWSGEPEAIEQDGDLLPPLPWPDVDRSRLTPGWLGDISERPGQGERSDQEEGLTRPMRSNQRPPATATAGEEEEAVFNPGLAPGSCGWYYDSKAAGLFIKIPDKGRKPEVLIVRHGEA